jgi:hypothetical protein
VHGDSLHKDAGASSRMSWLITGPAAAGKTTSINMIKEILTDNYKNYKCLAPTNLATSLLMVLLFINFHVNERNSKLLWK